MVQFVAQFVVWTLLGPKSYWHFNIKLTADSLIDKVVSLKVLAELAIDLLH